MRLDGHSMRLARLVYGPHSSTRRLLHVSCPLRASEDAYLRAAFDEPQSRRHSQAAAAPAGLFGYAGLHTPRDLDQLSIRTHRRAEILVRRITEAPLDNLSPEVALLQTAKQFDRLSDVLCSVIDMSEAIRQVHPDVAWVETADEVYARLAGFMNLLNTDIRLYETLRRVAKPFLPLDHARTRDASLFSAAAIAQQLLFDFDRSGIALPDEQRQLVVVLNDSIMQLSRRFARHEGDGDASMTLTSTEHGNDTESNEVMVAAGMRRGRVTVHAGSWQAFHLAQHHPSEEVRRQAYNLAFPETAPGVSALEELLRQRKELALIVGSRSYAELTLKDKMAKTPDNVMSFLRALAASNKPSALRELQTLRATKARQLAVATSDPRAAVHAWDKDYLAERSMAVDHRDAPMPDLLSHFFSVGTVVQGLSRLFTSLYGISLQIDDASQEPVWHPSVRKLAVIDDTEGRIGTIYADLFARNGKDLQAAHYTVRCARRVDDDDRDGDWAYADDAAARPLSDYEVLDQVGRRSPLKAGRHQLPIIVFTCGVQPAGDSSKPSLLQFDDVLTVFHECGHAIHSMIGRTDFHEVAGTRCATDFVELPSVLMESFATSPAVLNTFARHCETDAALPFDQLERHLAAQHSFNKLADNQQITMAALDQAYHADLPSDFSSTATLTRVQTEFSVIPAVPHAAWQTRFTHLTSYGASYYSYLFDRAIANQVWRRLFAANPLSRTAGERYKMSVLRHGSSRDPWECIGDLLQDDIISRGGSQAMRRVGEWGVEGGPG